MSALLRVATWSLFVFVCVVVVAILLFVVNPLSKGLPLLPWQGLSRRHPRRKVFGIGLPRTGTSSLSTALEMMGLKTWHAPPVGPLTRLDNWTRRFEALTDMHTVSAVACEQIIATHPDALYVLTTRPTDDWFASITSFYASASVWTRLVPGYSRMRSLALGLRRNDLETYNNAIVDTFTSMGKRDQLLVLNVSDHDAWARLRAFVNGGEQDNQQPHTPFPRTHPITRHLWQSIKYIFT
jgi:hypothetical protein